MINALAKFTNTYEHFARLENFAQRLASAGRISNKERDSTLDVAAENLYWLDRNLNLIQTWLDREAQVENVFKIFMTIETGTFVFKPLVSLSQNIE